MAGLLHVLAAVSLSSVWNNLLWGFWRNRPHIAYINPLNQSPERSFQFFGQTFSTVTPVIVFWSIIARVSIAIAFIALKTRQQQFTSSNR